MSKQTDYPKIVRCRWTGQEALVDCREAEWMFRAAAPVVGFTVLLVVAVLILALLSE